jgi:hypothetical protein
MKGVAGMGLYNSLIFKPFRLAMWLNPPTVHAMHGYSNYIPAGMGMQAASYEFDLRTRIRQTLKG